MVGSAAIAPRCQTEPGICHDLPPAGTAVVPVFDLATSELLVHFVANPLKGVRQGSRVDYIMLTLTGVLLIVERFVLFEERDWNIPVASSRQDQDIGDGAHQYLISSRQTLVILTHRDVWHSGSQDRIECIHKAWRIPLRSPRSPNIHPWYEEWNVRSKVIRQTEIALVVQSFKMQQNYLGWTPPSSYPSSQCAAISRRRFVRFPRRLHHLASFVRRERPAAAATAEEKRPMESACLSNSAPLPLLHGERRLTVLYVWLWLRFPH